MDVGGLARGGRPSLRFGADTGVVGDVCCIVGLASSLGLIFPVWRAGDGRAPLLLLALLPILLQLLMLLVLLLQLLMCEGDGTGRRSLLSIFARGLLLLMLVSDCFNCGCCCSSLVQRSCRARQNFCSLPISCCRRLMVCCSLVTSLAIVGGVDAAEEMDEAALPLSSRCPNCSLSCRSSSKSSKLSSYLWTKGTPRKKGGHDAYTRRVLVNRMNLPRNASIAAFVVWKVTPMTVSHLLQCRGLYRQP
jgi:hypothetical protein